MSLSPNTTLPEFNLEFAETSPSSISDSRNVSVRSSLLNHDEELLDNVSPSFSVSQEFNSNSTSEVDSEVTSPTLPEVNAACTDNYSNASLEECTVLSEPLYTGSSITVGTAICDPICENST